MRASGALLQQQQPAAAAPRRLQAMAQLQQQQRPSAIPSRRSALAGSSGFPVVQQQQIQQMPLQQQQQRQQWARRQRPPAIAAGCGRRVALACRASAAAAAVPMPADRPSGGLSKLLANVRAAAFTLWTFTLAVPLFVVMTLMALPVLLVDKYRRLAQHYVNNLWAIASTTPFYSVTVEGAENLPASGAPAVYVANHQSFMDIFALFHLRRPFKFISKTSNFLIPIVGWSMFLTGHVMLNRVDRRSQLKCLQTCIEMLGRGAPVLFFPEGTRSKDKVMGGFKKGAFSVAVKAGAPVVPVTLVGTGDVMPNGREGEMYAGKVRIVVHPPIAAAGRDADAVCAEARRAVASALPPELVGADDSLSDA